MVMSVHDKRKAGSSSEDKAALAHEYAKFLVAMRQGDTPVPIPNTKVKTLTADGTMRETAWESRWLPESKRKNGTQDA